jgi:hypothetical protein
MSVEGDDGDGGDHDQPVHQQRPDPRLPGPTMPERTARSARATKLSQNAPAADEHVPDAAVTTAHPRRPAPLMPAPCPTGAEDRAGAGIRDTLLGVGSVLVAMVR